MKSLVSDGGGGFTTLIAQTALPSRFKKHDPWLKHAYSSFGVGTSQCASGRWVRYVYWGYKSGITFVFPIGFYATEGDALIDYRIWTLYQVPGLPGIYQGEGYNFIERKNELTKINQSNFLAWLASH
jgi:hypothetical protein